MTDIFRCSSVLTENERLFSAEEYRRTARVETLLKFSFSVTVVSPSLTEKLAERAEAGEINTLPTVIRPII